MILRFIKMCLDRLPKFRIPKGQSGFATGIVMIFAVLFTMLSVFMLGLNRSYTRSNLDEDQRLLLFYSTTKIVESSIFALGQNTAAWEKTVEQNASAGRSMSCMKNGTYCDNPNLPTAITPASDPSGSPVALTVDDVELWYPDGGAQTGKWYTYSTQGFKMDGTPCTYNATVVTNNCVFRVRIRVIPACDPGCFVPPDRMTYYLEYESPPATPTGGGLNFKKTAVNKLTDPYNIKR